MFEDRYDAFVDEPDRAGRLSAATAAAASGPLHRQLVGVKDIFGVPGLVTRAGSRVPPEVFDPGASTAVQRLVDAGAVVAGKTATAEFAWAAPPSTRNPIDPSRTPGGSSSGSAAAVAAGYCPLALGTQTIGSVIRPASYCGVIGFKPTYGRVPTDGVVACAPSLDTVGLFAASFEILRVALEVVCDGWGAPSGGGGVIGLASGVYLELAGPQTREAFSNLVAALGFELSAKTAFDDVGAIGQAHRTIVGAEMAEVHRDWFASFGDSYQPQTADMISWGQTIDPDDYQAALAMRTAVRERLAEVDFWLSPAATGPAPIGQQTTGDPSMNLPWTFAGVPVMTLPLMTVDGLPVGLQVAGRWEADEELLVFGEALSRAGNNS